MKRSMTLVGTGLALLLGMSQAAAAPSAVGIYGGRSAADGTYVLFETTRRGFIKNLEIAGLTALCTTTIPGSETLPAEEISTTITRSETPLIRLQQSGQFSDDFDLIDAGRVDFQGARVRVTGRLRGDRGHVLIVLTMNETYGDGSTQVCGGSVRIPVERTRRR